MPSVECASGGLEGILELEVLELDLNSSVSMGSPLRVQARVGFAGRHTRYDDVSLAIV